MISSSRFFAGTAALCAAILLRPELARGQSLGIRAQALNIAPVDAAALGDTLRSSLGLYATDNGFGAAGGFAAWRGALRGYAGTRAGSRETNYNFALGYARTLATRRLVSRVRGTLGAEVVGAYLHYTYTGWDNGGVGLTVPIGVSLGDPSGSSLGIYAAPYVASGIMRVTVPVPGSCSRFCSYTLSDAGFHSAAGIGLGGRASMGPLSLELGFRDVTWRRAQHFAVGATALGITYRLGR